MPDFSKRSYEPEIMDDLNMEGAELASTLRQIANVNKWLGGTALILNGIKKIIISSKNPETFKIADFGCGGGEILREIAIWARKNHIKLELTGFDANAFTIAYAKKESAAFSEIKFEQLDIFEFEAIQNQFDISLCSLFLHHFKEEQILMIIKKLYAASSMAVLINDLQRSELAYYLFKLVTFVIRASKMVRHDGLLSIRKSFRKNELKSIATEASVTKFSINWKWAFRYEMLLLKN
jgi:hypothetical protein